MRRITRFWVIVHTNLKNADRLIGVTTKSADLYGEMRRKSAELTVLPIVPEFQLSLVSVAGIRSRQIRVSDLYAIQIRPAR